MARKRRQTTAQQLVHRISKLLDAMAELARGAKARADAGDTKGAVKILLDVERRLYEVTELLNAVSLL
jgi:hypothetical protein